MTDPASLISEWVRQLQSQEMLEQAALALKYGKGIQVVLRRSSSGKVGTPKVNVGE